MIIGIYDKYSSMDCDHLTVNGCIWTKLVTKFSETNEIKAIGIGPQKLPSVGTFLCFRGVFNGERSFHFFLLLQGPVGAHIFGEMKAPTYMRTKYFSIFVLLCSMFTFGFNEWTVKTSLGFLYLYLSINSTFLSSGNLLLYSFRSSTLCHGSFQLL